jgi:hypothetical protein
MHHGHARVNSCAKVKPTLSLKQWISRQTGAEKGGTLTAEHKKLLENLGFKWRKKKK